MKPQLPTVQYNQVLCSSTSWGVAPQMVNPLYNQVKILPYCNQVNEVPIGWVPPFEMGIPSIDPLEKSLFHFRVPCFGGFRW